MKLLDTNSLNRFTHKPSMEHLTISEEGLGDTIGKIWGSIVNAIVVQEEKLGELFNELEEKYKEPGIVKNVNRVIDPEIAEDFNGIINWVSEGFASSIDRIGWSVAKGRDGEDVPLYNAGLYWRKIQGTINRHTPFIKPMINWKAGFGWGGEQLDRFYFDINTKMVTERRDLSSEKVLAAIKEAKISFEKARETVKSLEKSLPGILAKIESSFKEHPDFDPKVHSLNLYLNNQKQIVAFMAGYVEAYLKFTRIYGFNHLRSCKFVPHNKEK